MSKNQTQVIASVEQEVDKLQSVTASMEQQVGKLQSDTESMSAVTSGLKDQVSSLKQEISSLQQANKEMAEQITNLQEKLAIASTDIEALNRLLCASTGYPIEYYDYVQQRYGQFSAGQTMLVKFGDGKQILFSTFSLK